MSGPQPARGAALRDLEPRWSWAIVLLLWLACSAVLLWVDRTHILRMSFNDPDDALRLVEVRDWMAGQSWQDVTQYRSQPPAGAPMHWSRLVDLPIAGLTLLGSWFLPLADAERVAIVAVPLLTLLLLSGLLHALAHAVSGKRLVGVLSVAMLTLSIGVLVQFRPNRIDHHGWQITLGTLAVLLLVQAVQGRKYRAVLAGIVAALALEVAIESLPLTVAIGAAFGVLHLWSGRMGGPLRSYLVTLAIGAALLPLVMLGWPAAAVPWCDALSPAYLWPVATAAILLSVLLPLVPQHRLPQRLATLAVAGAGAALAYRLAAPQCAAGPFATLDPLVYRLWYRSVMEGLPIWSQSPDVWIMVAPPSLLGLAAGLWAAARADADRRPLWIVMLVVQAVTFLVSMLVMRAMGLAHLMALPASAWLFLRLFRAARGLSTPLGRIAASVLCVVATPIGVQTVLIAVLPTVPDDATSDMANPRRARCLTPATLHGLSALPRATLFAPLDIGAHLLVYTPHSIIATGHHRARAGMKTVITAFTATPDRARALIMATPASYVVLCPRENEVLKYARLYPTSIDAALLKGRLPDWLQPVPMRLGEPIRVYRILRPVTPP
ncbi:hypothetical protein LWE61_03665 [Sphingobium sufflavum]|uniref:hypothetical protein n=1 Tax=Sphingobium sufflavum TaxID=1129547 RepID=UPI001F2DD42D|nr:hypothetical protein [Sphingobium sufflavum]MCE7795651.1 hypothetical protein [Sphingobium sufflavum]